MTSLSKIGSDCYILVKVEDTDEKKRSEFNFEPFIPLYESCATKYYSYFTRAVLVTLHFTVIAITNLRARS